MTDEELEKLIAEAKKKMDSMTKEEKEEMWKVQREGFVKAEMTWPRTSSIPIKERH